MSHKRATRRTTLSETCVLRLSTITRHFGRRASGEQGVEEGGVVLLGAGLADAGRHLAGRHVESRNHRLRAVADVFEFPPSDLARLNRQVGGGALQRLHAGHFVDRHRANVLPRRRGRLVIERANLGAFALELEGPAWA